ncbi:MAG: hypothetical protein U0Z53_23830 [Blastocatellia bacterium]
MAAVNQPGALVLTLAPGQTIRLTIEILGSAASDEATRTDNPRQSPTRTPEQNASNAECGVGNVESGICTPHSALRTPHSAFDLRHEQLNREIRALAGALALDARSLSERICREFEVDAGLASLDLASKELLLSRLTDECDEQQQTPVRQRIAATAEQQRAVARLAERRGLSADQASHHWYNCTAAQLSEVEAAELIVRLQERTPKGNRAA